VFTQTKIPNVSLKFDIIFVSLSDKSHKLKVKYLTQTLKIQYKSDVYLRCGEKKYKLTEEEREQNDKNEEKGDDDLDNDNLDNRIDNDDDNDGL
jgi:hypothetical protein